MRALFVLGRVIFGGYFVCNGVNHLLRLTAMSQDARAKGVLSPEAAVQSTGALLVFGGLSVVTGVKPRQGLAAIVAFLLPVSLRMHRFWEEPDRRERMDQMINFAKNMALAGAALALMQIDEPWPVSVEEVRTDREEMFVRLGGRDLRSLPA